MFISLLQTLFKGGHLVVSWWNSCDNCGAVWFCAVPVVQFITVLFCCFCLCFILKNQIVRNQNTANKSFCFALVLWNQIMRNLNIVNKIGLVFENSDYEKSGYWKSEYCEQNWSCFWEFRLWKIRLLEIRILWTKLVLFLRIQIMKNQVTGSQNIVNKIGLVFENSDYEKSGYWKSEYCDFIVFCCCCSSEIKSREIRII